MCRSYKEIGAEPEIELVSRQYYLSSYKLQDGLRGDPDPFFSLGF